jgi:hypothetical protein
MIINQIIKKNNILTDSRLPDSAVLTQKLVNVIYANYENKGAEFKIHLKDLCHQLNISNQTRNHDRIKDSLLILKQPIELRNFLDKDGRKVKWYLGSFLDKAKIFDDTMDYVNIRLDEDLIEGMKQYQKYTQIDIETSNKFKTKYGLVIWEMYLRYKNAPREKVPKEVTYQTFSLEELNKKFGTNYKYNSDIMKCINRGLKEIEAITEKKITVKWQKKVNKFGFFWKKEKELPKFETDEREFIKYIRTQYVNELLLEIDNYKNEIFEGKVAIACSSQGKLYDMYQQTVFNKNHSKQLWTYLFTHQNKITALKQAKFDF